MKIGVIGYGYWGPNIVRNFLATNGLEVLAVCDLDKNALQKAKQTYPQIPLLTQNCNEILTSANIDVVAIVTPVSTHFELAKKALENGKHIFVEKPFTASTQEAETLVEIAEKKNKIIMVDHTFLFTSAVRKIKQILQNHELGNIWYYDSTRINLGLFQHDVNVVWDLAPHDFSIMDYLLNSTPTAISAHGMGHINHKLENTAYITAYFQNNLIAHFNVNWLSPVKVRSTLIGGDKKMLIWNDLETDEKIKIYDKGVDVQSKQGIYNLLVSYRSGDMFSPKLENTEALRIEAEYFRDCLQHQRQPINNGYAGLRVVRLLEACDQSIKNQGKLVKL